MIGSVVEKEDEDNVINSMNKPEIVDSMVENVVKKMMKIPIYSMNKGDIVDSM